jgi:hypothetical protein
MREEVIGVFNAMKARGSCLPSANYIKVEKGQVYKTDAERTLIYRAADIELDPGVYEAKKTVMVKPTYYDGQYPGRHNGREKDFVGRFYIHRSNFEDVIETACMFADPRDTYRQLDKMLWIVQKRYLLVVTTDGKRLYRGGLMTSNEKVEGSYVVPICGNMTVLKAMLKADRLGSGFDVSVYKELITFKSGLFELVMPLFDTTGFPSVGKHLEEKHTCKIYDLSGCENMVRYMRQFVEKSIENPQALALYKDKVMMNHGVYSKHFLKEYESTIEIQGKMMHPIVLQLGVTIEDDAEDIIAKYKFDYFADIVKAFGDRLKLYVDRKAGLTFFVKPAVRGWF